MSKLKKNSIFAIFYGIYKAYNEMGSLPSKPMKNAKIFRVIIRSTVVNIHDAIIYAGFHLQLPSVFSSGALLQ